MKIWVRETLERCFRKDYTGQVTLNINQGGVTQITIPCTHKPPKEVTTGTPKEIYGPKVNTTE